MRKTKPSIRFSGFTDDWEERKLKDVLDISKTKNKAQQYGKVDVLSVSREVGTVNQIKYQGRSFAGSDLSNYKVVQGGELIYTKSPLKGAPYGIFQVATIKGILSPLYAVYTSTDKAYTPFVAMALKNDNIATHYLTPLVTKGAKNTINVTDEGALEGKIQFPNILEQKQIFIFFKQLDETIDLHQRQLDLLKEQKKGFLQKMFPKQGAKVPELRFAGFTDDWEERKLGELVEQIIREVPKPNKPYYRMSVRSHAKGTFKQFVDNPENVAMDKLFVVKKDDLVVNITFAWEHAIAVVNEENDGLLVSHRFPTYRADGKSDIEFLHHVVSKENFRRKLEFISPGGAGRNRVLNKKDFLKLKIFVPKIEEQQKIGLFFKQLDETIALHQRQLDSLKEQKKGFLQQMFV